jgi:hypothetical protein
MDFYPGAAVLFLFGLIGFWFIAAGFAAANLFHIICLRVYGLKQFFPHACFLAFYCVSALLLIITRSFAGPALLISVVPFLPICHLVALPALANLSRTISGLQKAAKSTDLKTDQLGRDSPASK